MNIALCVCVCVCVCLITRFSLFAVVGTCPIRRGPDDGSGLPGPDYTRNDMAMLMGAAPGLAEGLAVLGRSYRVRQASDIASDPPLDDLFLKVRPLAEMAQLAAALALPTIAASPIPTSPPLYLNPSHSPNRLWPRRVTWPLVALAILETAMTSNAIPTTQSRWTFIQPCPRFEGYYN